MTMFQDNMMTDTTIAGGADVIFDVGTEDFEDKVMRASMEGPVIVDFWAPWCGPCKQLMPVLEKLVNEMAGQVRLAKVNIDDNPELAQALRVQSVPMVFAFFQGQPVTAFSGMKPESEIKQFIAELLKMAKGAAPDAIDIPATLAAAAQALSEGQIPQAQSLYMSVLEQDEVNAEAFAGLARSFMLTGQPEQAQAMIAEAPEEIKNSDALKAVVTALELAMAPAVDTDAFEKRLSKNENDHEARFELAMALFSGGRQEDAIDALIEIIKRDRGWEEDKARQQLLTFFEALGMTDPLTISGRRKLSSVLFS